MMKLAVIASVLALSATGAHARDDGHQSLSWTLDSLTANSSGSGVKVWTIDDEDEEAAGRGNSFGYRRGDDERNSRFGFRRNDDNDDDGRGTRLWRDGEESDDEGGDD